MGHAVDLTHRRAWDLIPWVVNDTAGASERMLVEQHLAGCADCREEFAFHRRLRETIERDAPPHAAEPAWARMQAVLERVEDDSANYAEKPHSERRSRWVAALGAAVALQAVALGTLTGLWVGRDASYQTLSRAAEAPAEAAIRLVPAPTISLGELRVLLDGHGLRIVQSSGDGAILGLAPLAGRPLMIDATIAILRRSPAVLLVEPIVRPGRTP